MCVCLKMTKFVSYFINSTYTQDSTERMRRHHNKNKRWLERWCAGFIGRLANKIFHTAHNLMPTLTVSLDLTHIRYIRKNVYYFTRILKYDLRHFNVNSWNEILGPHTKSLDRAKSHNFYMYLMNFETCIICVCNGRALIAHIIPKTWLKIRNQQKYYIMMMMVDHYHHEVSCWHD